jgi:hypothetical protein
VPTSKNILGEIILEKAYSKLYPENVRSTFWVVNFLMRFSIEFANNSGSD